MSRPGIIVDFRALTQAGRQITQWAQCAGWAIVIVNICDNQEADYHFATEWLEVNGVTYDMLLLREIPPGGSLSGTKLQLYNDTISDNYKTEFVLDTDPVSGLMYRMNGLKVLAEWQDGTE